MSKQAILGCLMGLGVLFTSSAAAAQSRKDGVATLNGGRTAIYLNKPQTNLPAQHPDTKLVTIYSNLGTGTNVYNAIAGTGVLGRNVPNQPFPEWLGNAFIPTADHTITQIQAGITYVQGPNTVIVSINDDNNGIPGKALYTWRFNNLPLFGTCCTLQSGTANPGVPVKKGVQYWFVVRTGPTNQGTWQVWNNNFNDLQGTFSNSLGNGWFDASFQELGAFGVFGQ